ncbi:ATP-binding protein [candidate division KSB1 bacterium]|nr:ATP-binding protein [candidate division KSB1 bacterium]
MRKEKLRDHYRLVVQSDLNEIQHVEEVTENIVTEMGFTEEDRDSLAISITEIVGNAITHGNRLDETKRVIIDYYISEQGIRILIQDEGRGFDLNAVDNPVAPENLLKESGRGIYIVRTLMDKVAYSFNDMGTQVEIIKYLT